MKKLLALAVALLMAAAVLGCAKKVEEEQQTQIPNPMVEQDGPESFEAMNIYIDAPEGASDVVYYTINDLAEVRFTLDGISYTLRASYADGDISGIYYTFDEIETAVDVDADGWNVHGVIKTVSGDEKCALATWSYGDCNFALSTVDTNDVSTMQNVVVDVAELICSYYAA